MGKQQGDRLSRGSQAGAASLYSQGVFCLVDEEVHLIELALGMAPLGTSRLTPSGRERSVGRLEGVQDLSIGMRLASSLGIERKTSSEILVVTSKAWGEGWCW